MMEEKMRGPPKDEVPKSPILHRNEPNIGKGPDKARPAETAAAQHQDNLEARTAHPPVEHKVAIITGASSGIGKAVALHLAGSNYHLVLVARKKDPLHEVERELAKYNVKTLVRECDVSKVVQVHEAVQHAIKAFGRIDVLVNSAGYGMYGELETMRLEDINGQMLVNYFGTVLLIKECLPKLRESKGVIVNIASMAGLVGGPKMTAYAASKHAVVGLSESLRFELDGTGVGVCCVCPSKVRSNFYNNDSFKGVPFAEEDSGIVPSAVARVVSKAIRERGSLYTVPARLRWQLMLGRLLPEVWFERRVKREMRQ